MPNMVAKDSYSIFAREEKVGVFLKIIVGPFDFRVIALTRNNFDNGIMDDPRLSLKVLRICP